MNLDNIQNCNRAEKVAILKLIIKIASADGSINEQEQSSIEEFLNISHLKTSPSFIERILNEDTNEIVSVFTSKSNIKAASKLIEEYAEQQGINPEIEGKILENIVRQLELKKKTIKFSPIEIIKALGREFSTLWGQESIRPELKLVWAMVFILMACIFGSFLTDTSLWNWFNFSSWLKGSGHEHTDFVMPQASGVISALFIFSALSFRGYFAAPTNFRNILFFIADVYLLSILAQQIIGTGDIEKSFTLMIGGGVILLLWLGIKELVGLALLAGLILFTYKIISIDEHIAWRAFPLIITGFLGLAFQSKELFSDFSNVSNSFFRTPTLDKELRKESIESTVSTISSVVKIAGVAGAGSTAAAIGSAVSNEQKSS